LVWNSPNWNCHFELPSLDCFLTNGGSTAVVMVDYGPLDSARNHLDCPLHS
jgi:hypothetical protein